MLPEITYPDIMSEYGDKAALIEGETVTVNVINPDGYNKITVKIDGALEKTITTMEDFVLESCKPGLYEIEMSGSAKSSRTTFFVAQATCSYDSSTHMLTFSSSNAVPEAIYVFTATPTNKVVPFTDTDVQAGQIDLSAYADSAYKYAKVGFRCGEYGVATWYSYDLHQWEAFNG